MAATITAVSTWNFNGTYNAGISGSGSVSVVNASATGSNSAVIPNFELVYGTGTTIDSSSRTPVNDWYIWQGSIGATSTKSVELYGGSDTNPFGVALAFTHLKYFFVGVIAPDGIISVRVGPQNTAAAWQGPWGGTGATVYKSTYYRDEWCGLAAGSAVTDVTADIFPVYNPGAASLTALIIIAGKK